jgi:hypothetical protein
MEVTFEPGRRCSIGWGCYRARLVEFKGVHGSGSNSSEAILEALRTARSFGYSGDEKHYLVVLKDCPPRKEIKRLVEGARDTGGLIESIFLR